MWSVQPAAAVYLFCFFEARGIDPLPLGIGRIAAVCTGTRRRPVTLPFVRGRAERKPMLVFVFERVLLLPLL